MPSLELHYQWSWATKKDWETCPLVGPFEDGGGDVLPTEEDITQVWSVERTGRVVERPEGLAILFEGPDDKWGIWVFVVKP